MTDKEKIKGLEGLVESQRIIIQYLSNKLKRIHEELNYADLVKQIGKKQAKKVIEECECIRQERKILESEAEKYRRKYE